ncbi:hypothetical protein BOX15_Mlig023562g1 [Macrostomum lignano]|uniref:SWIB domain-containing protein n=2 Tax=Macrostomum lignano TaxID=282301 RepID=A0A1I8I1P9_9PLAT|nr:hypothetical protein BOX15_Mlig023562g1 [Macrostomum lignano]
MVENSVLHEEVTKLLAGADLNDLTVKKVRKELEQRLGVSLADRKTDIEQAIEAVLTARGNSASNQDEAKSSNSGNEDKHDDDDDTDSSLSELEDAAPSRKSAKLSSASSAAAASSSASAKKKQKAQTDEELARELHLKENGLTTRRRRTVGSSGDSSATKSRKAPRKSGGGFSKPCALSPALASVVGCDSMPRQQVVKRLWDIAKEREMFDPKNKQFVICDAEFEQLFGKKRLRMFALMKYLKNHVKNVD